MKVKISFTIDIDPEAWTKKHRLLIKSRVKDNAKGFFEAYCKEYARFTGTGETEREPKDLR
jgi:uncharacterized lipoprotein YbaY